MPDIVACISSVCIITTILHPSYAFLIFKFFQFILVSSAYQPILIIKRNYFLSGVKLWYWYFDMCCSNSILAGLVEWRSESIENYSSSGGKREASKLEESGQADEKGFTQLKKYLWNKSHHFDKRQMIYLIEIRFTLLMKGQNCRK